MEGGDRVFRFLGAVHALGLVNDDNGVGVLDVADRRFSVEPVLLLVDDVLRFSECVNIDDHNLNIGADGKRAHIGQLGGIVDEIPAGRVVIECGKVLLGDLQGLIHTLPNGNGRHNDDELGKTELLVQLKNRLGVDVGFARSGLHLNGELIARQVVRFGQIVPLLDRVHIGQQLRTADLQSVPNAIFRLDHSLISTLLHTKGGGGPALPLK